MPGSAVEASMREFKQGLVAGEAIQMQAMAKRWITVENALDQQILDLTKDIAERKDRGEVISQSKLYQLQRYQSLIGQTQREFAKYADWSGGDISNYQRRTGTMGIQSAVEATRLSYAQGGVTTMFDRLPVEAVENIVGYAKDGSPLNLLLRRRMVKDDQGRPLPGVLDRITSSLITGTAQGQNPRKVATMMRDDLAGGLAKALLIARTEGLRPYREMSRQQYEASGVVSGQRRLTGHDGRVCAACLADEGSLYRLNETIPDHPNGRCTSIPVVKGMPQVEWLKGEDWLLAQPEEVQRSILRPAKFQLWKDGAFDFKDIVSWRRDPVWGLSLSPKSAHAVAPEASKKYMVGAPIAASAISTAGYRVLRDAVKITGLSYEQIRRGMADGKVAWRMEKINGRMETIVLMSDVRKLLVAPPPPPQQIGWLTIQEAADTANLSTARIRGLGKEGKIIVQKREKTPGGRMVQMVDAGSLRTYLANKGKITPPPPPLPPPPPESGEWVTVSAAATMIGKSTARVRGLVKEGKLTGQTMKLGTDKRATLKVSVASINAYLGIGPGPKKITKVPPGYAVVSVLADRLKANVSEIEGAIGKFGIKAVTVYLRPDLKVRAYSEKEVRAALEKYLKELIPKGYKFFGALRIETGLTAADLLTALMDAKVPRVQVRGKSYYPEAEALEAVRKWKAGKVTVGWLKIADAATYIGKSTARVRGLLKEGKLTGERRADPKTGRKVQMVSQASLDAYLGGVAPPPPKPKKTTPAKKIAKPDTTGRYPPSGMRHITDISSELGLLISDINLLRREYNLTTYQMLRRTKSYRKGFYLYPDDVSTAAGVYGFRVKRTMEAKRKEAAEVRVKMVEKYQGRWRTRDKIEMIEEFLEVPKAEQTTMYVDPAKRSTKVPDRFKRAYAQVQRLVSRKSVLGQSMDITFNNLRSGGRAFHRSRSGIFIAPEDDMWVVCHELGHELEEKDREIHKQALAFYDRRTKGEKLAWMGRGFEPDEMTRKDKFLDAYMGKDYKRDATELVSMGIQYMVRDPYGLASRDPDMFDWIYAVLRE